MFDFILCSSGYALTALALDVNFALVVVTMGVGHGLGFGLIYAQIIGTILKVSKREY